MDRTHVPLYFVGREIVLLHVRGALNRLHERERRIQHQRTLPRRVGILQGIAECDWAGVCAKTATDTDDREIDGGDEENDFYRIIDIRLHARQRKRPAGAIEEGQ